MCGIVGSINWSCDEVLPEMVASQHHRGPDDGGCWYTTSASGVRVGLGSRRLAILDLSEAGHMPMSSPDGNLTAVYNGEIYNFRTLRRQLESKGEEFSSDCDTEVVIRMYQEFGPDCVKQFNGMFAFAIWDEEKQELFVARDHFGIKPLYYTGQPGNGEIGERFAFSSEVKSLIKLPGFERRIDYQALHQYLTFLWVPDPLTLFDGVKKVPAGHYGIYKEGKFSLTQYWDLEFPSKSASFPKDERELAVEVRDRFSAVVKSQMISDVPLGAFLSAGLDSSSIVACMAQHTDRPIKTFTIAFPKKYLKGAVTMDDTQVAARTAEHFGCDHQEIVVQPKVVDLLPKLIWHMDEPVADPALMTAYLVNKNAQSNATVLLSGVGGDELFGGYRKYVAHELALKYQKIPSFIRSKVVEPLASAAPSFQGSSLQGYVRLAKKMARSGSLGPRQRFLTDSVYLSDKQKQDLYTEKTKLLVGEFDSMKRHFDYFEAVSEADFLNQMLYLDSKAFMASLNLTYNDKMSMASSVEVRVPFLDWEFAQWVATNVPPALKIKKTSTKHILREAMKQWLPKEVLRQKKAGFGAPVDHWLSDDLHEMTEELLSEEQIQKRGLFRADYIRKMIEEHRLGEKDWGLQIWQFLTLEIWMQTFIDG